MPFQTLIKAVFDLLGAGGIIVASWKELAVLILMIRVLGSNKANSIRFPIVYTIFFSILVVIYFIFSDNYNDALISAKVFLFPLAIGYCAYKLPVTRQYERKVLGSVLVISLISFIIAHLQQYLFKTEFALFFGIAESLSDSDEIIYTQSALKILNIERMYGVFAGPNELGLYTALVVVILFYYTVSIDKFNFSYNRPLIICALIVAVFTLLQTFSRVSWIYVVVSLFTLLIVIEARKLFAKFSVISILIGCVVFITVYTIPEIEKIYISSINLEESSARARPEEFLLGLDQVIKNPFGYGLGRITHRSSHQVFHTEIFWWMTLLEIGIIGGGMLAGFYLINFIRLKKKIYYKTDTFFTAPATAFSIAYLLSGFGSLIVSEPIFLTYLWTFIGLGFNSYTIKNV